MPKFYSQFIRSGQSLGWLIGGVLIGGTFVFKFANLFLGDIISSILGGIVCVFLLRFVFKRTGVEIDFETKKIRIYKSFFWRRTGEWRDYKEFPFYRIKTIITNTSGDFVHGGYQTRVLSLMIYDRPNKKSMILLQSDRKTLRKFGKELSLKLEMIER